MAEACDGPVESATYYSSSYLESQVPSANVGKKNRQSGNGTRSMAEKTRLTQQFNDDYTEADIQEKELTGRVINVLDGYGFISPEKKLPQPYGKKAIFFHVTEVRGRPLKRNDRVAFKLKPSKMDKPKVIYVRSEQSNKKDGQGVVTPKTDPFCREPAINSPRRKKKLSECDELMQNIRNELRDIRNVTTEDGYDIQSIQDGNTFNKISKMVKNYFGEVTEVESIQEVLDLNRRKEWLEARLVMNDPLPQRSMFFAVDDDKADEILQHGFASLKRQSSSQKKIVSRKGQRYEKVLIYCDILPGRSYTVEDDIITAEEMEELGYDSMFLKSKDIPLPDDLIVISKQAVYNPHLILPTHLVKIKTASKENDVYSEVETKMEEKELTGQVINVLDGYGFISPEKKLPQPYGKKAIFFHFTNVQGRPLKRNDRVAFKLKPSKIGKPKVIYVRSEQPNKKDGHGVVTPETEPFCMEPAINGPSGKKKLSEHDQLKQNIKNELRDIQNVTTEDVYDTQSIQDDNTFNKISKMVKNYLGEVTEVENIQEVLDLNRRKEWLEARLVMNDPLPQRSMFFAVDDDEADEILWRGFASLKRQSSSQKKNESKKGRRYEKVLIYCDILPGRSYTVEDDILTAEEMEELGYDSMFLKNKDIPLPDDLIVISKQAVYNPHLILPTHLVKIKTASKENDVYSEVEIKIEEKELTGQVINVLDGYGFISPEKKLPQRYRKGDVFFHFTEVRGQPLKRNDRVAFKLKPFKIDKPEVIYVRSEQPNKDDGRGVDFTLETEPFCMEPAINGPRGKNKLSECDQLKQNIKNDLRDIQNITTEDGYDIQSIQDGNTFNKISKMVKNYLGEAIEVETIQKVLVLNRRKEWLEARLVMNDPLPQRSMFFAVDDDKADEILRHGFASLKRQSSSQKKNASRKGQRYEKVLIYCDILPGRSYTVEDDILTAEEMEELGYDSMFLKNKDIPLPDDLIVISKQTFYNPHLILPTHLVKIKTASKENDVYSEVELDDVLYGTIKYVGQGYGFMKPEKKLPEPYNQSKDTHFRSADIDIDGISVGQKVVFLLQKGFYNKPCVLAIEILPKVLTGEPKVHKACGHIGFYEKCKKRCTNTLLCGHQCEKKCPEECPKFCEECQVAKLKRRSEIIQPAPIITDQPSIKSKHSMPEDIEVQAIKSHSNQLQHYKLRAKREFSGSNALDMNYRIAESQFLRFAQKLKFKYEIESVDYYVNPNLVRGFYTKKHQFENAYGKTDKRSTHVLAFHGTDSKNVRSIIESNFDMSLIRRGLYGRGIYLSEFPDTSLSFGGSLLLCKVLPGQSYDMSCTMTDANLKFGYDSHRVKADEKGYGWALVLFDPNQILPCYVINYRNVGYVEDQRRSPPSYHHVPQNVPSYQPTPKVQSFSTRSSPNTYHPPSYHHVPHNVSSYQPTPKVQSFSTRSSPNTYQRGPTPQGTTANYRTQQKPQQQEKEGCCIL